jgi:alcohol dehydrogenase, propanol-preferring
MALWTRPRMRAMLLSRIAPVTGQTGPLEAAEIPVPVPGEGEILLRVSVCGVCHTELDEIEGRTAPPRLPVVPGHQVVGTVERCGPGVQDFTPGDRAGVGWIFSACGMCPNCRRGAENLCPSFRATGRDANGGYAELMTVPAAFAHPIPSSLSDTGAAPLLCAGAIGYRSLRLSGLTDGGTLGLMGFGASAHLVLQIVRYRFPKATVFVFTRSETEREFGLRLGAAWAGRVDAEPPRPVDCIIDTTPAWKPVVESLRVLAPGGRLVINAIRKENADRDELLRLDYPVHLWQEKQITSVANVTRQDVRETLLLAAAMHLKPEVQQFPLEEANAALIAMKQGHIRGAKVLVLQDSSS